MDDYLKSVLKESGLLNDEKEKGSLSYLDEALISSGLKEDPNKSKPGFISDIKRGTGQVISSIGSTLQDIGPEETGKALEEYGNKITRRNPSSINTVGEALSSPFTTIRESIGEVIPQVGVSGALGIGGRILGGAIGSLVGPAGTIAGQAIGGAAAAYAGNLLQEYGGIRSEQRESGNNDIAKALATGGTAAILDTALGAEAFTNRVLGKGASILEREAGKKLLPHAAKQAGIGLAEEAGTEALQTGLERYGAGKELTGADAYNEYGLSAIKGGIGGGIIRGGTAALAGQKRPEGLPEDNLKSEENDLKTAINGSNPPDIMGPPPPLVGPEPATPNRGEGPPLPPELQMGPQPAAPNIGEGPPLPPSQQMGPPTSQQVADANAQAKQEAEVQKKAEEQAAHDATMEQTKQIFNAQPNEDGGLDIAGKRIYSMPLAKVFLSELYKTISKYRDVDKTLASAVVKSGAVNINDKSSAKSLIGKIGSFLDTYQLHHVETIEEAAAIVDKQIGRLSGPSALKEATILNNFHKNLTGTVAPSFAIIEKQTEESLKAKETKTKQTKQTKQTSKGELNGQQTEQQQVPARVGNVPVTGGATETGTGNLGLLQSTSLGSIGTGSDTGVSNSQQNVGTGETGSRDNASGTIASTDGNQQKKSQRVIHSFDETPSQELTNEQPTAEPTTPAVVAGGTANENEQPATNGITNEVSGSQTTEPISRSSPEFLDKVREEFEKENNTPEGQRWRHETGLDYANLDPELKTKWARAVATGNVTPTLVKNMLADFDEKHDVAAMLADRLVTESNRMTKGALGKLKTLFAYLVTFPKEEQQPKGVLAEWFNVSQADVSNWRKNAYKLVDTEGNIRKGWSETSTKLLRDAIDDIKAKTGIKTDEEFKAALIASKKKIEDSIDYKSAEIKELTTQTEIEKNVKNEDEEEVNSGITESERKSISVNEQYNKGEHVTTEGIKVQSAINKLKGQLKVIEDNIAKAEETGDNEAYDNLTLIKDDIESAIAGEEMKLTKIENEARKAQKSSITTNLTKAGADNALQEQSTNEGDVSEPTSSSKKVGKGNTKSEKSTRTRKTKTEKKEVVKTEKVTFALVATAIKEAYKEGDITSEQQYDLDLLFDDKKLSARQLMEALQKAIAEKSGANVPVVKTNSLADALKAAGVSNQEKNNPQLTDESNTIEGEARIVSMGEEQQVALLTNETNKLTEGQTTRLETHYKAKKGSDEFIAQVKKDVLAYVNKGADAVAGAIRDIIKQIANGVMSVAIIFNPGFVSDPIKFAVPTYETRTEQVVEKAPAEAAKNMSPAAQRAYEVIFPAIKENLATSNKLFIVTDKPTATQFIFKPDGTLLFQSKVLVGKSVGDFLKGNNNIDANKITPAGLMTLVMRQNTSSTKGYDFNTVFGVEGVDKGEKYFTTLMHSVWLNEKDAAQRQQALSETGPSNSRYSFGCINTDKDTFGTLLKDHKEQMDGAMLFVVPDNQENVMEFVNGKAVFEKDITRQGVTPKTKTVVEKTIPKGAEASKGTQLAAKEEKLQFSKGASEIGSTVAQVKQDLKDFIGLDNSKIVFVVQSISDFPSVIQSVLSDQERVAGFVTKYGKAYLIADNIDPQNIRAVFMHEVGAHLGLQEMLSVEEFEVLVDKINAWSKNKNSLEGKIALKALQRVAEADTPMIDRNDELIAYFIEEAVKAGINPTAKYAPTPIGRFLSAIVRAFKQAFEKLGFKGKNLTAQDIVDMAYGAAHQVVQENEPVPSSKGKMQFSMKPISAIRAGAQKRIDALPPTYRGPVHAIFDTLEDIIRKGAIWATFTEDLASVAKKYIPSVVKYVALMKERSAIRTMRERRIDDILTEYQSLDKSVKGTGAGSVNAFLKKATMEGKWAYQPTWLKDPVTIDPEMKKQFDALIAKDKKAGELVKKVFEHGYTDLVDMKQAVTTNITTEYDALIKLAEAEEGNEKEVAELQKKKADELRDFRSLLGIQANLPYAPLKRFGNYVVVGKSDAYLEAEKQNDRALIRKLEKDGNEYFVQFAETWAEAKAISRSQEGKYASVEPFEKDIAQRAMYGGKDVNDVFERLRTLADESLEGGSAKSKKAVDSLLVSLKLSLLSQHSARQAENHRRNIAGAEDDMMRSFATQGRANAHFISSLHNTDKIYDQLRSMKEEADASTPGRGERRRYYNEFMKRHSMGFNYQANPLMDKALGVTSLWMLLSSPAHFLQNATQPFMMSMPVIAGKHGEGKTFKALLQAYKEIGSIIRSEGLNEKSYAKLPADVRQAIETLVNSGRIDISLESDLGSWKSEESKNVASIAIEKLRKISQDIESINRVVTAVAAYRLEMASGKSTQEEAIAYADQIILDTHGDYSGFNAPRFTRQGMGRFMTQFRKFQLIQISLIAKLGHQAFKGVGKNEQETKDIRFAGKKALAFTLGHTFAAAGVMGMPGFGAIAWIIGKIFGDDDEPDNPEATLRKIIGDDTLANLLLKGVPKLGGVDLSGKLGMGQMLSILPYTDIDLSRDGYARAVTAAMGPFIGGLLPKAVDGVGLMTQGNYYKGLEAMAPKGIADALKAVELANKGITQRNGDVTLSADDIGVFDLMGQALGLPTNTITDKQFIRNAEYQTDKFYKERTTELKTDYVRAFREGDTEAMTELRQRWEETQVARVRNGEKRQPISDLFRAPQEQVKRQKDIKGGISKPSLASGITER